MEVNQQLIATLAHSEGFQKYARAYTAATGMPLALRPVEAYQLPFRGMKQESPFCALMAEKSRSCAACLQLQLKLTRDAAHRPATRTCAYGLCETAVPVKLGTPTIGFLQTGQVLRQPPTDAAFQRAVAVAARRGVDIDQPSVRRAFFQTPVVRPRQLAAAAGLLAVFAEHLELKSNQLMLQTVNAESSFILRAKQFIRDHCAERISLGQVSNSVNTSRFYFCKQFRQGTGLNFTEFVSRTRVETAKTFLLNPNLRVSEIAFAAGFQSLTQFSRMFKRIVGKTPTDYRGRLPVVKGSQWATTTIGANQVVCLPGAMSGNGQRATVSL